MKRQILKGRAKVAAGPSQRQLRAGELIRHALVDILREHDFTDPDLEGVSVTVSEVRMTSDLKHAICFIAPLGGGQAPEVVKAMNRHAKFLRGLLGHNIDMRFTPALKFLRDESFEAAEHMTRLFDDPRVKRDLEPRLEVDPFGEPED